MIGGSDEMYMSDAWFTSFQTKENQQLQKNLCIDFIKITKKRLN